MYDSGTGADYTVAFRTVDAIVCDMQLRDLDDTIKAANKIARRFFVNRDVFFLISNQALTMRTFNLLFFGQSDDAHFAPPKCTVNIIQQSIYRVKALTMRLTPFSK